MTDPKCSVALDSYVRVGASAAPGAEGSPVGSVGSTKGLVHLMTHLKSAVKKCNIAAEDSNDIPKSAMEAPIRTKCIPHPTHNPSPRQTPRVSIQSHIPASSRGW